MRLPHRTTNWLTIILSLLVIGTSPGLSVAFAAQTPVTESPVFVGAGDISSCNNDHDEATAGLLDGIEGTVFTLGDNAYGEGSEEQFASCYNPTWGRHLDRTHPAPGNHEYRTPHAAPYFAYFGEAAGDPSRGYYSFDLGEWHIISLNSNCDDIGGCDEGSKQLTWLQQDLTAHPAQCTLAYWHHPRFSSGEHGNDADVAPLWDALYDSGAEVVLSGHDHTYERFAPQDSTGAPDPEAGVRQFVVGTGGAGLYDFVDIQPNSELRNNETFGVLKLTLHPDSYEWEFIPAEGATFTDSGSAMCH
jgi:acid phosphatase type 7